MTLSKFGRYAYIPFFINPPLQALFFVVKALPVSASAHHLSNNQCDFGAF